MKTLVAIVLIVLCFFNSGYALDTNRKIKQYKAWITTDTIPLQATGILYEVKHSSIVLINPVDVQEYSEELFKKVELNTSNIEKIKIRRKNNSGRAALFGAAGGLAVGILIGLISGDDQGSGAGSFYLALTAEEKATAFGLPLAMLGAGGGALLGTTKVQIPLHLMNKLEKYSVKKQSY